MNRIVPAEELKVQQPVQDDYPEQEPVDMIDDQDQQLDQQREVEEQEYEETEQVEQPEEVEQQEEQPGYQKKNFKRLREEKERIEQEKEQYRKEAEDLRRKTLEYENYLNYMASQQQMQQQAAPQEKPVYSNLKPDELAEWHAVQGYTDNKFSETQKEINRMKQELAAMNLERRVLTQHPDWYQVCSHDNVSKLKAHYPEVAAAIISSQDQYAQAASTYSLIKKLGIDADNRMSQEANKKFEQNKNRPRSAVSVQGSTTSPISQANRYSDWDNMTEQQKQALAMETRRLARGA